MSPLNISNEPFQENSHDFTKTSVNELNRISPGQLVPDEFDLHTGTPCNLNKLYQFSRITHRQRSLLNIIYLAIMITDNRVISQ